MSSKTLSIAGLILMGPQIAWGQTHERQHEADDNARTTLDVAASEEPAATGAVPAGASRPGSPLQAYDATTSAPETAADAVRNWEEEPGVDATDVALFLPRALLWLPRMTLKLLFIPFDQLLKLIDRYALIEQTIDFFCNDARSACVFPVVSVLGDFGLGGGVSAYHNDLFDHGETLSLSALFGGRVAQSYQLSFKADRAFGTRLWLESLVRYEQQPGQRFLGIGNPAEGSASDSGLGARERSVDTRFSEDRFLGLLRTGVTLGDEWLTQLGVTFIYNNRQFGPEKRDFAQPSIETVYDTSTVPGFRDSINSVELNANLILDTRDKAGPSSGFFFEAFGGGAVPIDNRSWGHYGAEATVFVNLYRARMLAFRTVFEGVEGNVDDIPFVELPRLGGTQRLRGYRQDQFRDKLSFLGMVQYNYPVQQYVMGELFFEVGKVGRSGKELFIKNRSDWQFSGGLGFIIHSGGGTVARFDVAYGDGVRIHFALSPLRAFGGRALQL